LLWGSVWQNCRTRVTHFVKGSTFNRSDAPNVSNIIETHIGSIRYTATRLIDIGEELCIFYGHNLWFEPVGFPVQNSMTAETDDNDGWGSISLVEDVAGETNAKCDPILDGDPSDMISEQDLPFTRVKLWTDDEDELSSIRTSPYLLQTVRIFANETYQCQRGWSIYLTLGSSR
jgi:tRNA-specific adenosine deaminase 3